jgi:hypothetical protein
MPADETLRLQLRSSRTSPSRNAFQPLCWPAVAVARRPAWIHYINATFLDLFENFDYASDPPANLRKKMLLAERDGYNMTDLFAVFHAGVRARLVNEYGVAHERIWVLRRGVNLDLDTVDHVRVRLLLP